MQCDRVTAERLAPAAPLRPAVPAPEPEAPQAEEPPSEEHPSDFELVVQAFTLLRSTGLPVSMEDVVAAKDEFRSSDASSDVLTVNILMNLVLG